MPEKPIQPPDPPSRTGFRTSEFLVTIAAAVAAILAQAAGFVPEPWGTVCAAASTAAYAISRGLAKSGTTSGP